MYPVHTWEETRRSPVASLSQSCRSHVSKIVLITCGATQRWATGAGLGWASGERRGLLQLGTGGDERRGGDTSLAP